MTCIAGIAQNGNVYIGGDSAGTRGYHVTIRTDPKVFKRGEWLFGICGSFRMGQLLRYSLVIPKPAPSVDIDYYLHTDFIDAVRTCFKDGGFASKENETEAGGYFLFGYRGRLLEIDSDYQIGEHADGFAAIGAGDEFALGSLHATRLSRNPERRLRIALDAAAHFSTSVRAPYVIDALEKANENTPIEELMK